MGKQSHGCCAWLLHNGRVEEGMLQTHVIREWDCQQAPGKATLHTLPLQDRRRKAGMIRRGASGVEPVHFDHVRLLLLGTPAVVRGGRR